jgi:hypothetical protein
MMVANIIRLPAKNGKGVYNEDSLYHDDQQVTVSWHTPQVDIRLKRGSLVRVEGWGRQPSTLPEQVHSVRCLRLLDKPLPNTNLFQAIPPSWVSDRQAVSQASDLWTHWTVRSSISSTPFFGMLGDSIVS